MNYMPPPQIKNKSKLSGSFRLTHQS